jgi:BCD family chlorophyll transporter-like MFS transporter
MGIPAFALVILSASFGSVLLFTLGALLVGFGSGLFGHGTLTATMNSAPKEQTGLALGAWGAVQATSAGVAIAVGGIMNDAVAALAARGTFGPHLSGPTTGYLFVYSVEIVLLVCTMVVMSTLQRNSRSRQER